jgi:NADH dehydrogenase FAD-containing subunit
MGQHLILVGGGHAHMTTLVHAGDCVQRGHRVTLVSAGPYHYYSGMGPGVLSGIYRAEEIRFHVKKMVEDRDATFVEGKVVGIDAPNRTLRLASGESLVYDVVSFNTGSDVPTGRLAGVTDAMLTVKPIEKLIEGKAHVQELLRTGSPRLLVVGGGAAGVEIAGNLHRLVHDEGKKASITVVAGRRLLAPFPEKMRRVALASLVSRGMEVIEGAYVSKFASGTARLSDGRTVSADLVFLALGVTPSPIFSESGLPTGEDGGLLVNHYLQSVAHPEIFGGGDCISLEGNPLDKVGLYAWRENPVLFHNLAAALEGKEMKAFKPQKEYLLILNLGNGKGIFHRHRWVWSGQLAFRIKDTIDRKFMRTFQVSGEQ